MTEGGTQEFLLNYLSLSSMKGAEVFLIQLNGSNTFEADINKLPCEHIVINHRNRSVFSKLNPYHAWKVYKIFQAIKPDVVHARLHLALIFGTIPAKLTHTRKFLYTIEGSFTQANPLFRFLVKIFSRWIDFIFTSYPCEYNRAGLPPEKYREYRVCIPFQGSTPVEEKNFILRYLSGGPMLASVGRLHRDKGHQYAIQAVQRLKRSYPDIRLFIAGTGHYLKKLQKLTEAFNLQDNVIFCGFVRDIRSFWRHMDLCLQCSKNENLNLSSLWALNAGVPVVKFLIPYMADHIDIQRLGIGLMAEYLSVDDLCRKIERLLGNKDLRSDCSGKAVNYIGRAYNARSSARYYDNFYSKLMNGKGSCAA